jgi:Xaa-Pro aminopeptidase
MTISDSDLMAGDDALLEQLQQHGPMNFARAYEVMERFGLDGLVVTDPLNVFHMLGYWPQIATTRLGQPPTTFAILARDQRQTPAIVTSHFIYYYTFVDGGPREQLQSYIYLDAADAGDERQAAPHPDFFADRGAAPETPVERRRRERTATALRAEPSLADAGGALVRALKAMGLWSGAIGYDHPLIRAVCERHARPGTLIPADNILRHIRIIKSPLELALMRRGAQANTAAVNAVVAAVGAGANYRDLRRMFAVESARRGNRAVFMTIDRVSSELPTKDAVHEGQSLFFDGVGHFQNYHGDYARTVFVGEPAPAARRLSAAIVEGWKAIREQLRPGLSYRDLTAIGMETLRKHGVSDQVGFGPHSVGMMHTDEPGADGGDFFVKDNLVLRENMVLSVDCPSLETGIGGSIHIEDLMVITADGAEPIHDIGDHVITV